MSLLACDGCDTRYDVSGRGPGKRVRCPKCRTVMVVPDDLDENDDTTTSTRLRRARGKTCARHRKTVAEAVCQLCKAPMCARRCQSQPPIDHACRDCATLLGLEPALPIDLGLFATYRLAFSAFFPSLGRVIVWSLLASLVSFVVCGIPALLGWMTYHDAGGDTLVGMLGGSLYAGSIATLWVLVEFLLLPAGCAVLIDDAIRKRTDSFYDAFQRAFRRVIRNAGALGLVFVIYTLLTLLLALLAAVVFYVLAQATGLRIDSTGTPHGPLVALAAFPLILGVGLTFLAASLGLAVPVVILEQRPAFDALGRAWELSQQRFAQVVGIVVVFAIGYAIAAMIAFWIGSVTFAAIGILLSRVLDLFWPALLVATYHGLSAEYCGVLGRGK